MLYIYLVIIGIAKLCMVDALHVGLVSIPCFGHVNPLRAVAAQLLLEGHMVTMITEHPKRAWCEDFTASTSQRPSSRSSFYFNSELSMSNASLERKMQCFIVPESGRYGAELWVNLSMAEDFSSSFSVLFAEMFDYHEEQIGVFLDAIDAVESKFGKLSVILTDYTTLPGQTASKVKSIPVVSLFPLTLNIPLGHATSLPMMGTGLGKHSTLTIWNRAYIWFMRVTVTLVADLIAIDVLVNAALVKVTGHKANYFHSGAQELGFMNALTFVPAMSLFDVTQPTCPNVISLGSTDSMSLELLHSRFDDKEVLRSMYFDSLNNELRAGTFGRSGPSDPTALSDSLHPKLEEDLHIFLSKSSSCVEHGAIYVNFGTLSMVSNQTFSRLFQSLLDMKFCVIWKITEGYRFKAVLHRLQELGKGTVDRFYIVSSGSGVGRGGFKSPPAIMSHPNTKVFISHCGDTSVLEAIEAQLPVAGIPMFADQLDVCQRVHESKIGVYVGPKHEFVSARLTDVVNALGNDGPFRRNALDALARVRHGSRHLGGAREAARQIELNFESGVLSTDTTSPPFYRTTAHPNTSYFFHPFACTCLHPRYLSSFDGTPVNELVGAPKPTIPWMRPSSTFLLYHMDVAVYAISGILLSLYLLKWFIQSIARRFGLATASPVLSSDGICLKIAAPQFATNQMPAKSSNLRVKVCKAL